VSGILWDQGLVRPSVCSLHGKWYIFLLLLITWWWCSGCSLQPMYLIVIFSFFSLKFIENTVIWKYGYGLIMAKLRYIIFLRVNVYLCYAVKTLKFLCICIACLELTSYILERHLKIIVHRTYVSLCILVHGLKIVGPFYYILSKVKLSSVLIKRV